MTADLDLLFDVEPDNARRGLDVLGALGFRARPPVPLHAFADAATRQSWVDDKGLMVFSLWSPDAPTTEVDLFVEMPLDFESAYARAEWVALGTTKIPVLALDDLIALKRNAGRAKDLDDVVALERIARARATEAS